MKYKVRDGCVEKGDVFWWLCEDGPEKVDAHNWHVNERNIREYPEAYQIKEPVYKRITEGRDEGLCVYEHEDRYKLLEQGKSVSKKPKVKRERPEFTFEDGFYFDFYLETGGKYSKLDNLSVFCQISGDSVGVLDKDRIRYIIRSVQQALKSSREICSCWEHKTLRKKLKLYVKWLQSEIAHQNRSKQCRSLTQIEVESF